ncbi:hypothetical protein HDU82_005958 [Entophlyctis luteolus]|nr:hypothetical protein HDU82_005958 [Entophlyctis luteolus]KAJ3388713.1 hypothetical protein HDU84_009558 [Entophlyctis sp. JEL0112]
MGRDTACIKVKAPMGEHKRQRPQAQYVPNTAKFDGLSSHKEAYQSWPVTSKPVGKHYQPFVALKDDRDFKSTTAAAYIDHPFDGRAESKGPVFFLPPSDAKFEGETTSQDAYRQWTIKPRERRSKAAYVANKSPFPTETTYTVSFQPKAIQNGEGRPSKFGPAYLPVASCKFEGISTHKADYLPTTSDQLIKAVDFAPKSGFVYHKDDRDFITTSKKAHCVLKPV